MMSLRRRISMLRCIIKYRIIITHLKHILCKKILRFKRTLALSHAVIVYPQMSDLAVWEDGEV